MENKKIAIVTGANGGIGIEVTKGMLREGFHVVMACRNIEKAGAAKEKIARELPSSSLEVMQLDLSDSESINNFAKDFKSKFNKLDVLINNAGILFNKPMRNKDGVEMQFATNHLGHFILTSLLIDLMPDSHESRIVSLGSLAHNKSEIWFDDLNCESQTKWDIPYAQSKLACMLFADELQRKLSQSGKKITSLSAHPGGTDSGLFEHMPKLMMTILRFTFVPIFLHSTESAARSILKAALDPKVKGGEYYGPKGLMEMKGVPGLASRSKYSQREDIAKKLWELSEKMTGVNYANSL